MMSKKVEDIFVVDEVNCRVCEGVVLRLASSEGDL